MQQRATNDISSAKRQKFMKKKERKEKVKLKRSALCEVTLISDEEGGDDFKSIGRDTCVQIGPTLSIFQFSVKKFKTLTMYIFLVPIGLINFFLWFLMIFCKNITFTFGTFSIKIK